MPDIKFIVEDTSPILRYSVQWDAGKNSKNRRSDQYSEASFMRTGIKDEFMKFSFYGTQVGIFGARRRNYGRYSVDVDGHPLNEKTTEKSDTDVFNYQLAAAQGLALGEHEVNIKNLDNEFLDVDYVTWVTRVGKEDTKAMDIVTIQADQFQFSRAEDWTDPKVLPPYPSLSSGRATSVPDATANFTFDSEVSGSVIALYGPVGPRASPYTVRLNGGDPKNYFAFRENFRKQQLLFFAGGLGGGRQTLEVTFSGNRNEELAIDYANIYLPRREGKSPLQLNETALDTKCDRPFTRTIPPSVISGLAFTTVIAILSLLSLLLIFLHYQFGWIPFLSVFVQRRTPRHPDRKHGADENVVLPAREAPLAHRIVPFRQMRRALSQAPRGLLPRRGGPPSAMTVTEVSSYPFSTSDYYASSGPRTHGSRSSVGRATTPSTGWPSLHSHPFKPQGSHPNMSTTDA